MAISRVSITSFLFISVLVFCSFAGPARAEEAEESEAAAVESSAVITLDVSNFTETVEKHDFIVVEFYAPWCGHCKNLAPEYEKAASILSKHDPPIPLAKVDASEQTNKEIADKFQIQGFPTLKILRSKGSDAQEYKGPREADGIVEYLKKQVGPASVEIKSAEESKELIGDTSIVIVGVFPEFSGTEFENYIKVAEKLRSDYSFCHTKDAQLLPRGDSSVKGPLVRLFKPFDELFNDHKNFEVESLEKFVEDSSMPLVVTFDNDPDNHPYLLKFFTNNNAKAMLFASFTGEKINEYKSKLNELAGIYKEKSISFLIGDPSASQGAFQYFGLKEEHVPLIVVQDSDNQKFLKANVEPDELAAWLKAYLAGEVTPFKKSAPIPETNDEPVKVVVADSLHDTVFKSGKNVLLEFYAPWCGHCKKLAPILEEVAVSLKTEDDIIIAKMDATANDVPKEFQVTGYPTMYFVSAIGKVQQYEGGRTAEDIINFLKENRYTGEESAQTEKVIEETVSKTESEPAKDEL